VRRIILRTPEEKADLSWCWSRPDDEFFASGACHVLAAAFLEMYPAAGFRAWRLVPIVGHRGGHMVAASDELVFDWAGYQPREAFVRDYFAAMRSIFPDWDARFEPVESDPIGWGFCRSNNHRHPTQFLHDPLPRARAFSLRFPPRTQGPSKEQVDRLPTVPTIGVR
jgi:hypothetical protein